MEVIVTVDIEESAGQQDSERVTIKKNSIKIKTTFKIQQRAKETFPFPVILDYRCHS